MDRRSFLKLLAAGVIGHELDIDRLLWVPGQKKIFLSSPGISLSQIIALEMERIAPQLQSLFERDDVFYKALKSGRMPLECKGDIRVPLIIKPRGIYEPNS